ncbi:transposase [Shigella sonnei str. Moseley]|nr:transposase [Shigella sonnei str. Moseley]
MEAVSGSRGAASHARDSVYYCGWINSELGDLTRFEHPRQLMSWFGITPSEYSSGGSRHQGSITKAGNSYARKLLVEAAW